MKIGCTLLLGSISFNVFADDLKLITDISRATGEVRVYIKNISDIDRSVLTRNLTVIKGENELTLSPDKHALIMGRNMVLLKEDLAYYGVVHLKPGETTYISNPNVDAKSSKVKYKIDKDWGDLHGVWNGTVEVPITTSAKQ